jgi:triosephosphate isomerase
MSQNKILAFNWKTNPNSLSSATELFSSYKSAFEKLKNWEKIVFPPFVYVLELIRLAKNDEINAAIGGQDISEFESGAHTSQISGSMLADLGCKYSLIGHSETRSEILTTSFDTAHKIKSSLENNLNPILCVGFEPKIDNENIDFEELSDQILTAIEPNETELKKLETFVIAYEPTWAIGTGKIPTLEQIESVVDFIVSTIHDHFGADLSHKTRVLYGGSVNDSNIAELAVSDKIAGFLIGGASLAPEKVEKMVEKLVNL